MTSRADQSAVVADDLAAALERLTRISFRLEVPGVLSMSAAAALGMVARMGPMRMTDLAAAEHVAQPSMTQLVTRLERDGLAERLADPEDRRAVLVAVTDAGRQLIEDRRASRTRQISALIDELPPDDRASIGHALPSLERLAGMFG